MGTPAAPRIDDRLRSYIIGSPWSRTPAEVTRAVGDLAWQLGLPRPSYQQVRELMGGSTRPIPAPTTAQTSYGRVVLRGVGQAFNFMYQYPGPGLADWYRRYNRGLV